MNDVQQFSGMFLTWDNGKEKIKPGRYSFSFVLVQVEQKEVTLKENEKNLQVSTSQFLKLLTMGPLETQQRILSWKM